MFAAPTALFSANPIHIFIQPTSSIILKGTSTFHDFECSTKTFEGTIDIDAAQRSFVSAEVSIPVKSIHSDNSSMDEKMYDALNADKYPDIHFSLTSSDSMWITKTGAADTNVYLRGTLMISGKHQAIDLHVAAARHANGILTIKGTKKILMTDYGIDPPTFMLGVLKTGNEVTVEFSFDLSTSNSQAHTVQSK
jgi:polyisoprenoid-binding protein YceI